MKSAVAAVRVTCTVPLPVSVPAPLITAPAAGVKVALEFTVNVPTTPKLLDAVMVAELAMARSLRVRVPELEMAEPLFNVIVPLVGAKVVEIFTVKVPATEKLADGCVVGVPAMVSPLNVNVPLLLIPQPVPVIVIVPPEGLKVAPVPTVRVPPMLKPVEVVTVALLAIVKPLNVRFPGFEMDAPLFMVIAPADGLKVDAEFPSVNTPLMLKLLEVVTVAVFEIVKLLNVSVPELEIDDPSPIVIVPLEGVKVALVPTVNIAFT